MDLLQIVQQVGAILGQMPMTFFIVPVMVWAAGAILRTIARETDYLATYHRPEPGPEPEPQQPRPEPSPQPIKPQPVKKVYTRCQYCGRPYDLLRSTCKSCGAPYQYRED